MEVAPMLWIRWDRLACGVNSASPHSLRVRCRPSAKYVPRARIPGPRDPPRGWHLSVFPGGWLDCIGWARLDARELAELAGWAGWCCGTAVLSNGSQTLKHRPPWPQHHKPYLALGAEGISPTPGLGTRGTGASNSGFPRTAKHHKPVILF